MGMNLKKWLQKNSGRLVTQFYNASLFELAFAAAATMTSPIIVYRQRDIWLIYRNVFIDTDFASAGTTNNPEKPEKMSVHTK